LFLLMNEASVRLFAFARRQLNRRNHLFACKPDEEQIT
jgi:hypothetical protein